jgi:hypothetical protein
MVMPSSYPNEKHITKNITNKIVSIIYIHTCIYNAHITALTCSYRSLQSQNQDKCTV